MKSKTLAISGGHYWCDRCDDNAFGQTCHICSDPTRFIPDESGKTAAPAANEPAPEPRSRDQRAAAYFQRMRELVAAAPIPQYVPNNKL